MLNVNANIVQLCFIVTDIDAAIDHWVSTMKAGPFFVQKDMGKIDCEYRGNPSFIDVSAAFGQAGAMQIELIEVHGDNPSVYRDSFPRETGGFHHVAMFVEDLDLEVEKWAKKGCELGMRGNFAGNPYAYIDTRNTLGFFLELYQEAVPVRLLYDRVATASKEWNGAAPIRPMTELFA